MNWLDKIKKLMLDQGITQDDLIPVLAPLSKNKTITRGAIGHYFTGRSEPSVGQIEVIANYLGVSLAYLFSGKEQANTELLEKSIKLVQKHKLDPNQQARLIAYIYAELSAGEIITKDKVKELVKLL
jgi:transcriptional regulator with XRE-family HTH domain